MRPETETRMGGRYFPPTNWRVLKGLPGAMEPERQAILDKLARAYWGPAFAYYRRTERDDQRAEDLTQGFFLDVVLRRKLFEKARRNLGSLHSLLRRALSRYRLDVARREKARAPRDGKLLAIEAFQEMPPMPDGGPTPGAALIYAWASELLDTVLVTVENACQHAGLTTHWEVFRRTVVEPAMSGSPCPTMKDLCGTLGISDEKTAASLSTTVRRRFRLAMLAKVEASLPPGQDVQKEIRSLMAAMGEGFGGPGGPGGIPQAEDQAGSRRSAAGKARPNNTPRGPTEADQASSNRSASPPDVPPAGIIRLLGVTVDPCEATGGTADESITDRLITWLSGPLPDVSGRSATTSASVSVSLPADGDPGLDDLLRFIGEPLADTLLDGQAGLQALRLIKEHYKLVSLAADSDGQHRRMATAIYFAAIGSALLQHDRKISRYPYEKLAEAFGRLAGEPWMAPELVRHFHRAEAAARSPADRGS